LRVFIGENDRYQGRPLHEVIVARALQEKMAGATVLPGPEGFGRSRTIRSELDVEAGPSTPMVVEIVDREDKVNRFLPVLDELVESALITLERVRAIHYRRDRPRLTAAARPPGVV